MVTDTETQALAAAQTETPSSPASPSSSSSPQKKRKAANDDVPEIEVDLTLPEPPSKRAKRALKKGKVLPAKPKSDDEDEDDLIPAKSGKKGDKDDNKKAERSQFGIWIGNLAFTVTRPQLFRWFIDSSGGAIAETDITRVNLPLGKRPAHQQRPHNVSADSDGKLPPPNKGFAYVDFLTYEAQVAATALSETELEGRRVLIKDSKSFEGRPAKEREGAAAAIGAGAAASAGDGKNGNEGSSSAPAEGMTSTKVFVGNLGFDTTEEDLRRHFTPCGQVAWVKVATFPDNTEKCRGYGWVQFGGKTDDGQNITPEAASKSAAAAVQGFVKITETIDTEEDFVAEAAAAAGDDEDEEQTKAATTTTATTRTKQRKWWVNQLKGRPLKIQFAEDDAMRYKKRFKKGPKGGEGEGQQGQGNNNREQRERRPRPDNNKKDYKNQDASIAYRTGAITASTGKKTMLE